MRLFTRVLILFFSLTLLVGVGFVVYLFWFAVTPPPVTTLSVRVNSVQLGDAASISASVHGDRVTRAELWADGRVVAREMNPNPKKAETWSTVWQWAPPGPGVYALVARAFDDAGTEAVTDPLQVVFPPRESLALASNRSGKYALFSLDLATRRSAALNTIKGDARQPSVSSLGTLAFAANATGAWHIWVQQKLQAQGGSGLADITPDVPAAQGPCWSPDGKQIVFELTQGNITNLYLAGADGKNRTQITQGDSYDGQASFAPNGRRIVFAGLRGGEWDLYAVDIDGKNLTRLTNTPGQDWQPAWSPDGNRIAFSSNRGGVPQIYLMPASGPGDPVQLTSLPSGAEHPAWSPDGNWVAFVASTGDGQGNNRHEVYLLYAPQGQQPVADRGLMRLSTNAFDDTEPVWTAP